jgi:putative two-component system response regulator
MVDGAGKKTIMIVDDQPENLSLLQTILTREDQRVVAFPRGNLALKAAVKKPPDLVLLDIMMPEMDGFAVCEHLKADEKLRNIPVLFISALNETEEKIKAFAAGGVDFVTKPFNEQEVTARVETHLTLRRMQLEVEMQNKYLEELVQEKKIDILESQHSTIVGLAELAEQRDEATGVHIKRTQDLCRILAEHLRTHSAYRNCIDSTFVENIYKVSPLHDIGKIGIPDNILHKPDRLTAEEFEIIKSHTLIGANILKKVQNDYPKNPFINMGLDIVRSHHEKWDGSGYPDGLKGEDIPLCSRIMALADVYDALRSKRPYKPAFSHKKSFGIIMEEAGSHFDPVIVDSFRALVAEFVKIYDQNKT